MQYQSQEACHNCDGRGTIDTWRGAYKHVFTDANGKVWYAQRTVRVRCPTCNGDRKRGVGNQ